MILPGFEHEQLAMLRGDKEKQFFATFLIIKYAYD